MPEQVHICVPGETVYADSSFGVEVVRALHGSNVKLYYRDAKNQDSAACSYLIKTPYGNIFHPGDSYMINDFLKLEVDYLLLPVNDTNLGPGWAAQLTFELQPKAVIPCHYGMFQKLNTGEKRNISNESRPEGTDSPESYYGTHIPYFGWLGGHPAEYITALAARDYRCPKTDIMILKPGGRVVLAK